MMIIIIIIIIITIKIMIIIIIIIIIIIMLEIDKVMVEEMKSRTRDEYFRRLRLILKSKLNGRNKIAGINTWAVSLLRYV